MDLLRGVLVPIHKEGYRFIGLFVLLTLVLFWIWDPLGWGGVVASLWCTYFFRDPTRLTPVSEGLVIAPADGVVQAITEVPPPSELGLDDQPRWRVSIFMNVFDVHVNRIPSDGEITAVVYHPGKFFNASLDKASEYNERQMVAMRTAQGNDIAFVQIAGLVARRILCNLLEGEKVVAGQRFGLIRFGSRVDVYLPPGIAPLVAVGQRSVAGETVLADETGEQRQRKAEER